MGKELKEQFVLLEDLNRNVDKNMSLMKRTNKKLGQILKTTSNYKLIFTIIVQIFILFFIITYI